MWITSKVVTSALYCGIVSDVTSLFTISLVSTLAICWVVFGGTQEYSEGDFDALFTPRKYFFMCEMIFKYHKIKDTVVNKLQCKASTSTLQGLQLHETDPGEAHGPDVAAER